MRTIKFRAWHKAEKVMCEVDVLTKEGAFLIGLKPEKYSSNPNGRFCKSDEFELMQFTGLTDCNGNEIFEYYIVKIPAGYGNNVWYDEFLGVIKYDAPFYYVDRSINISKTGKWSCQDYDWDKLEVIGNIYQNSDLL